MDRINAARSLAALYADPVERLLTDKTEKGRDYRRQVVVYRQLMATNPVERNWILDCIGLLCEQIHGIGPAGALEIVYRIGVCIDVVMIQEEITQ